MSDPSLAAFPESYQEYLETIYRLSRKKPGQFVKNVEIAREMNIRPPSVTEMLEKLRDRGLLRWEKRQGVELTPEGVNLAKLIVRNHLFLEILFLKMLGIKDPTQRHELACAIEHHVNAEFFRGLESLLDIDEEILEGEFDLTPEVIERVEITPLFTIKKVGEILAKFVRRLSIVHPEHEGFFESTRNSILKELKAETGEVT
ncbi:MAG: hypothetical protein Kow0069_38900 [Promethearchaeota archaeon]